jgi:hypothetical protein
MSACAEYGARIILMGDHPHANPDDVLYNVHNVLYRLLTCSQALTQDLNAWLVVLIGVDEFFATA